MYRIILLILIFIFFYKKELYKNIKNIFISIKPRHLKNSKLFFINSDDEELY